MTLEELKNFNPNTHEIYHVRSRNKYSFNYKWVTKYFYPDIILESLDKKSIAYLCGDNYGTYHNVRIYSGDDFLNSDFKTVLELFEIKPIKKESKMKTTFKQEPTKTLNNSFPKFMKYKESPLVVLFFNEDSGVVVVEDQYCKVNQFSNDWDIWDISLFEPIENCEVTFSNKE